METGRFQPPIEQERFGRAPDGAEGLSGSFVRAAYGATGVNQNPGDQLLTEPTMLAIPAKKRLTQRIRAKSRAARGRKGMAMREDSTLKRV